jgi:Bacteriocin-protection, YdeI or OmpD-Associated/Domain of unknown function (DUF1905)
MKSSAGTRKKKKRPGEYVFAARLESMGEGDAWTVFRVPFSVEEVFGTPSRVSVKGTVNGFPFRSSLFPMGDGQHFMMVNPQLWKGAKIKEGRAVQVALRLDSDIPVSEIPRDFKAALSRNTAARSLFEKLPYTEKKEYIRWVMAARRVETRARRVRKAVDMIMKGRRSGEKMDDPSES